MNPIEIFLLFLAVYRICRFIIEDTLFEPVRDAIWKRFPPNTKLGYLLTCYWCTSIWVAIPVVLLYILFPTVMMVVALILALSAMVGILDTLLNRYR